MLAVGFFGHGLWRLLNAAVGHRTETDPRKKWGARALSLVKGLVYASLGVATVRFLLEGASSDQTQSRTAELMAAPFGRVLVGVLGLVVVGCAAAGLPGAAGTAVAIEATLRVVVSTDSVEVATADQLVESVQVAELSSMSQVMSISKSRPEVAVLPWK